MKTISANQAKGLAWFLLVYALSRFLLSLPVMGDQSPEIFGIFFGAMSIAWMVYVSQKSERQFCLLVASLFVASVFIFLYFGHFGKIEIMIALGLVGGISFFSFLFFLNQSVQRLLKKKENMLRPMVVQAVVTTIVIITFEYALPAIKSLIV